MSLILALDNGSISKYCRSGHPIRYILCGMGLACLVLLSSCNSKKYLLEEQSFLMKNTVSIDSDFPIHSKSELVEGLLGRYRQSQTKYSLGFPRHVFYYKYQQRQLQDSTSKKWDDERIIKNRPVIYDSLRAEQTDLDFEKYLALRGYRSARVTHKAKTEDKKTKVAYAVDLGPRMFVDTFMVIADDSVIQQIIDSAPSEKLIEENGPMDVNAYNQERQRLVRLLQNEGYATFDETFVSPLEVDTSHQKVKAIMRLKNPSDSTFHQKYLVGQIEIYPDFDVVNDSLYFDTTVNNIIFHLPDTNEFTLKPEAIYKNVFLHTNEYTKRDNLERTIKNLGRIDIIKFVTPNANIDTSVANAPAIDYAFFLTRNKKINFDVSGELTYSTIAATADKKSLFGTAFSAGYRDLNTFKKAEVFNINVETGFEFNFFNKERSDTSTLLNSLNLGLGTSLSFRRFMDPLNIYQMIGHSKNPERKALFGSQLHKWFMEDASSRLGLGFNYVIITDLYEYYNVNANLLYDIKPDFYKSLTISRIGFDLFVPSAKPAYQKILDGNKFLDESFGNQLYTGLFFRNYLYEVNSKSKGKAGYFKMLHSGELSGIEMNIINRIANKINHNGKEILLNAGGTPGDEVQFSQFVKGEIDVRYYRDLGRNSRFALKVNTGVASRYGPYTKQVPYPKQFYVGGALSNRAWQIRQLGPGSYDDPGDTIPSLPFYQTGDFKIDLSAELQFKLFWYFNGAIFVDAANVWILQEDTTRVGAQLTWNFLNEFGVGYGYGIRLDLDFFVLRLDLGYKLLNPFPVDGDRLLIKELKKFPGGAEPQIAVGLPF